MKKYYSIPALLLLATMAHAQSAKPTGGCSTFANITQVAPLTVSDTTLYNGRSYSLKAILTSYAEPCYAPLYVYLGTLKIGSYPSTVEDSVTIPLDAFHVAPGKYWLYLYATDGTDSIRVTVSSPLAVNVLNIGEAAGISLYPVPATDVVHVSKNNSAEEIITIQITDNYGRVMPVQYTSSQTTDVSVATLPAGMYTFQVQTTTALYNKKVVIAH